MANGPHCTPEPILQQSIDCHTRRNRSPSSNSQHHTRVFSSSRVVSNGSPRPPLSQLHGAAATRRKPTRPPSSDPNRPRNNRAREILRLRQEVTSMQRHIEWLHASALPPQLGSVRQRIRRNSTEQGLSLWARVAARKRAERRLAERRNRQLKRLVEVHHRVDKHLERLIQTVATQAIGMAMPRFGRHVETMEKLLQQVEESYAEAEQIVDEMNYEPCDRPKHN